MQTDRNKVVGRPFPKGVSGNPIGRPRKDRSIERLAKSYTSEAVETLVDIMRTGKKDNDRREAAKILLQYGWGRPRAQVEVTGEINLGLAHLEALKALNEKAYDACPRAGEVVEAKLISPEPECDSN